MIQTALTHYGTEAQILQTVEECAELQQALLHHIRNRPADVVSEIADVEIMCASMRIVFGSGLVDQAKAHKLARLAERVAIEQAKPPKTQMQILEGC